MYEDVNFDDCFVLERGPTLIDKLRDLLPNFGDRDFTVATTIKAMEKVGISVTRKNTVSTMLTKLALEDFLVYVRRGRGNVGNVYRVAKK